MPPKRKRIPDDDDYDLTSSSDSFDGLDDSSDDSSTERKKKKKRYSSDDEYDPTRDNVAQATSYRKSKKRTASNFNMPDSNYSNYISRFPNTAIPQSQNSFHQMATPIQSPARVLTQPVLPAPGFSFTLAQMLSNPIPVNRAAPFTSQQTASHASQESADQCGFSNIVIDVDDEAEEETGTNEAVEDSTATPAPIESTRKSDFESTLLQGLTSLVTPVVTLNMECETVCEELDDSGSEEPERAEKVVCPEYEYGLRRTVFNNDLILTCETVSEEDDCSYSYPEELTVKQRADYDSKLKAHFVFQKIFVSRKTGRMTEVDLEETGETLSQFKERLRQEMKAAAQSQPHHKLAHYPARQ